MGGPRPPKGCDASANVEEPAAKWPPCAEVEEPAAKWPPCAEVACDACALAAKWPPCAEVACDACAPVVELAPKPEIVRRFPYWQRLAKLS